jgi:hypothetical protein
MIRNEPEKGSLMGAASFSVSVMKENISSG